jgi:hypothetical protein
LEAMDTPTSCLQSSCNLSFIFQHPFICKTVIYRPFGQQLLVYTLVLIPRFIQCFLFKVKWAIFQPYPGENKLH